MSRSIHTTRRDLSRLRRMDCSDGAAKAALLREAYAEKGRKRLIKSSIGKERHRPEPPMDGTATETIKIECCETGPCLYYPLDEADLRDLLNVLPADLTHGLARIQLLSGRAYMDERATTNDERDPLTGRPCEEIMPGVYVGDVLGTYTIRSQNIALYAIVCAPETLATMSFPVRPFVRLQVLQTFLHEIAHHHDHRTREGRGRWMLDQKSHAEHYAEHLQRILVRDFGLPWLERRFAVETRHLLDWVEEFGGCRLSLRCLAGDPRHTQRTGGYWYRLSMAEAVEALATEMITQGVREGSPDTWLSFAQDLLRTGAAAEALSIFERVIAAEPESEAARIGQADALLQLSRFAESLDVVAGLLERNPHLGAAYGIRARVMIARLEWSSLLELCATWLRLVPAEDDSIRHLREYGATACCALNRRSEMEAWLAPLNLAPDSPRSRLMLKRIEHRAKRTVALPDLGAEQRR